MNPWDSKKPSTEFETEKPFRGGSSGCEDIHIAFGFRIKGNNRDNRHHDDGDRRSDSR